MLLFKDSIRLFAAYNEGVINMLGKLFNPRFMCIDPPLVFKSQHCNSDLHYRAKLEPYNLFKKIFFETKKKKNQIDLEKRV